LVLGPWSFSTFTGSTRAARRAGTTLASAETNSRIAATAPKLTASCGVTPNRNFWSAADSQKDAINPAAMPAPAMAIDWPTTRPTMS